MIEQNRSRAGAYSLARLMQGWPLAVTALAACWLSLFYELHGEWSINPQYSYGFVVPLLGAILCWRRWPERPAPSPGNPALAGWVAAAALFWFLPVDVFFQANPEWRLLYWFHGFLAVILSGCLLYRAGGWKWVRYFAPPLLFMLIAIPWPMEFEQGVIQHLMRFVAGLTVGVVGWIGIPAVQHGNLIEIGSGVVGINEACSGVRSLQSALMLSLFLGEINRLTAQKRAALVGASLVFVVIANVFRTSFLTYTAANRGLHAMQAVHDPAGLVVMGIVLAGLFSMGYFIRSRTPSASGAAANGSAPLPPMPRWVAISVFVWIGVAAAATDLWYRAHERNLIAAPSWTVSWPAQAEHFKKTVVPEESLAILRCSDSEASTWEDEEGNRWSAFLLRWKAGGNSVQLANGHRPDICYPAAGDNLVQDYGRLTVDANGIDLPFTYQTFENGAGLMHVFYCLWSDRVARSGKALPEDGSWKSRLQAVLAGQRNLGQQVLEVDIMGPYNKETALSLFRQELPRLIRPD